MQRLKGGGSTSAFFTSRLALEAAFYFLDSVVNSLSTALSSNGQDGAFSRLKSGFDSP